jgi:hypothetical protein
MNFFNNAIKRYNDGPLKAELDKIKEQGELARRPSAAFAKVPPAELKKTIAQIKKRLGLDANISISDLQTRLNAADERLRLNHEAHERAEAEREERRQAKRRNARQATSSNTQNSVAPPQKAKKQPLAKKRRMADPSTATSSSAPPTEDGVEVEELLDDEDNILAPLVDVEEEDELVVTTPTVPPRTRRAPQPLTEEVVVNATPNVVMTKQRKARVEAERLKTKADRIASVIAMPPTPNSTKRLRKPILKEEALTTSPELTSTEEEEEQDTDIESSEAPTVLGGFTRAFNLFGSDNPPEKEAPTIKRPATTTKAARPSQNKSVKFRQQPVAAPPQRSTSTQKKKRPQQEVVEEETDEEEDSPPPQRRHSNKHAAAKKQAVAASKSYRCRCFSWRYLCYVLLALIAIVLIYYILWFLTYAMCLVGSTAGFNTCWLWHRPTSYYASSVITTNMIVEPPPIVSPVSLTVVSQQQEQQSWWQYATGGSWWSGRSSQVQQQSPLPITASTDKPFAQQGQPKQPAGATTNSPNQQPGGPTNVNRLPTHHPGAPNTPPSSNPVASPPAQNVVPQRKQPVCAPNVAVNEYFGLLVKSYNDRTIGREQITKSGANDLCFALLTNGNRHQHITMRREVLMIYDTCSFSTMEEFFQKVNQNLVPFDHELSEEFAMLVHDQAMSDAAASAAQSPD